MEEDLKIFDKEYVYLNQVAKIIFKNIILILLSSILMSFIVFFYKYSNKKILINKATYVGELIYFKPYRTKDWDIFNEIIKSGSLNLAIEFDDNTSTSKPKYDFLNDFNNYITDLSIYKNFNEFLTINKFENIDLKPVIELISKTDREEFKNKYESEDFQSLPMKLNNKNNKVEELTLNENSLIIRVSNKNFDTIKIFLNFFSEFYEVQFANLKKKYFSDIITGQIQLIDEKEYFLNKKLQIKKDTITNNNSLINNFFDYQFKKEFLSLERYKVKFSNLEKDFSQIDISKLFFVNKKFKYDKKYDKNFNSKETNIILPIIITFLFGFFISSLFFIILSFRNKE